MARPYKLFDDLLKEAQQLQGKNVDIQRLATNLSNIAKLSNTDALEHYKEIGWLIIYYYYSSNNGIIPSVFPYEVKIMIGGKGILGELLKLPPLLLSTISVYIEKWHE